MEGLTHINAQGRARMVDVSQKAVTLRTAVARATVRLRPETLERIEQGGIHKGDVLAVAQVAGIQAAKRTAELIPMCHLVALTGVDIHFEPDADRTGIHIKAVARCKGETGVEMEALTAVSVAALTIYDMCKAVQRDMTIEGVALVEKSGGASDWYRREE